MLDGLLGRGFSSKCKSLIKLIIARIDVIRRKRNAMLKFLKKDIADLLTNGLDINAYGRAEGLLGEINLSTCYDTVEQLCGCILKQLRIMQKQSECPEECREAVPSLMFAAARLADLPELRDLRHLFTERYGNSLDPFVSKEFVENLAPKPHMMDKKLQLLRDIAKEFSIKWDSRAFERMISNPSEAAQDQSKKNWSFQETNNDGFKSHVKEDVFERGKKDISSQRKGEVKSYKDDNHELSFGKWNVSSQGKQEITPSGYKHENGRENTAPKRGDQDPSHHGRQELGSDRYKPQNRKEEREFVAQDTVLKRENLNGSSHKKWEHTDNGYKPTKRREAIAFKGHVHREEISSQRMESVLGAGSIKKVERETESRQKVERETESPMPFSNNIIPPPYVKPKGNKYGSSDCKEVPIIGSASMNGHEDEKDYNHEDEFVEAKRKPRSSKRRHMKPPKSYSNIGSFEDDEVLKREGRERRREARKGLQILFDDHEKKRDEEEKMMDKLLIHYSKKQSTYEPPMNPKLQPPPPSRTLSLPPERKSVAEVARAPARAASFKAEVLIPAGHVHPKLPDYDDLAARFAALRER